MKKVLFLLAVLLLSLNFSDRVKGGEVEDLTNVESEECLETLIENGLVIPEEYEDFPQLSDFVYFVAYNVIQNPDKVSWFNYDLAQDFALTIREVVLSYIGADSLNNEIDQFQYMQNSYNLMSVNSVSSENLYLPLLTYSTVINGGVSPSNCVSFNCYSYALHEGRVFERFNPGKYIGISVGPTELYVMSVDRLATLIQYDLQQLGYTNVTISTVRPSYQNGYKIIALRKSAYDYHVMFEYSKNVWRHKPGISQILKYNYSSLTLGRWVDEGISIYTKKVPDKNTYVEWTTEYTGTIIYIKYKLIY